MSWIDSLMAKLGLPGPYHPAEHPVDPDLDEVNRQVREVRAEVFDLSSRVAVAEKQLQARGMLPRRSGGRRDDIHD
jgi:hypothetical protein